MTTAQAAYLRVRAAVVAAGFEGELVWQEECRMEKVTEQSFLTDVAFVILNSGMRAAVIRGVWQRIMMVFGNFQSTADIVKNRAAIRTVALRLFNSPPKIDAIIGACIRVFTDGWPKVHTTLLERHPSEIITYLRTFRYVGPVIVFHLAKNLGLDVAKPDRHLVRIAARYGYDDVQEFCRTCAAVTGDRVGVVDLVWWRYAATVSPGDYLGRLKTMDVEEC